MRYAADNFFDVELETYAPTLFDSDSIDPQVMDADYVCPQPQAAPDRPMTRWDVLDLISKVVTPQIDVDSPVTSNCTWTGSGGDTVAWSKTDAAEPIIFRYKGTSYEITPDSTTEEFIYWDPNFTTLFKTTNDAATAVTLGKWYMCRNVAGAAYPTVPFPSVHAGVLQAGTITAAYGQIANAAITTAKIADLAVETLKIKDEAVTVPSSSFVAASISFKVGWVTTHTLTITSTGSPLLIGFSLVAYPITGIRLGCRLKRDANVLVTFGPVALWDGTYQPVSFVYADTPAANTYTYTVQCQETVDNTAAATNRSMYVIETKK